MKKVMMLTTTAYMSERFNRNNIILLEEMGYEVHVVANFDKGNPTTKEVLEQFKVWIEDHHGKWISIPVTKSPADVSNNYKAYKQIIALIKEYNYEFIHCHTPVGGVLGRFVAHRTCTKVIYTAHGFHFFTGAPLLNWMLYYPVERFLSRWTDMLITINQEDYNRAKKSFHAKRTEYIPGVGIDTDKYILCDVDRDAMRDSLGISTEDFVIISVGEVNRNKNHEVVIRAIAQMHNPVIKYIICGEGALKEYLLELCEKLEIKNQVFILGYKSEVKDYLHIADVFAFPSKREGLGLAALEAMASGLPLIASNIHGIKDYLEEGVTGCGIMPNSEESVCEAIVKMYNDKEFREKCISNNLEYVKKFDIANSSKRMEQLYNLEEKMENM